MANVLVEESSLQAIANAIRNKTGGNDTYKPREMAPAIRNLPGTGVLQNLSVTENGNYAPAAGVDGFGLVSVAVPNSALTSADEGKVVVSGALMPQTSLNVSANGTYDTTTKNSVIVNVSGGGGGGATILSGNSAPTSAQGSDGNVYLCSGATVIESIRSNGNQWIQTGYAPQTDNVIFELDVNIDSVNSGNCCLIAKYSPYFWIITHISPKGKAERSVLRQVEQQERAKKLPMEEESAEAEKPCSDLQSMEAVQQNQSWRQKNPGTGSHRAPVRQS